MDDKVIIDDFTSWEDFYEANKDKADIEALRGLWEFKNQIIEDRRKIAKLCKNSKTLYSVEIPKQAPNTLQSYIRFVDEIAAFLLFHREQINVEFVKIYCTPVVASILKLSHFFQPAENVKPQTTIHLIGTLESSSLIGGAPVMVYKCPTDYMPALEVSPILDINDTTEVEYSLHGIIVDEGKQSYKITLYGFEKNQKEVKE